jgi:hypothetical protein
MKADTAKGMNMNTTTLKLTFTDPEQQRMLFGALMSYIEDCPVMIFGSDGTLLHGHETAKMIDRGDEAVGSKNCLCSRCAAGRGELIAKLLKEWSRRSDLNR